MNRAERRRQSRDSRPKLDEGRPLLSERRVSSSALCEYAEENEPVAMVLLFACGCSTVLEPVAD